MFKRTARLTLAIALSTLWLSRGAVLADGVYRVKSGRIAFSVGSNVPLLKVTGASSALTGGGEGIVNGNTVTIRDLHIEVDPTTFKTGIDLRDQHLYEKVFRAVDGSMPRIALSADRFEAKLDPTTSKWEGNLKSQLTMRGITRQVSFRALGEKKGDTTLVNATGIVNTSLFGVKRIDGVGVTVREEVKVTVSDLLLAR